MASWTCKTAWRDWGTISLCKEAEYPGTALFHGKTFEIFPAGALGPYRIEHSGDAIHRIVVVDPNEHDVLSDLNELIVDPMFERLALLGNRSQRATFPDYSIEHDGSRMHSFSSCRQLGSSTIEEAAGRRDSEREYLDAESGRG